MQKLQGERKQLSGILLHVSHPVENSASSHKTFHNQNHIYFHQNPSTSLKKSVSQTGYSDGFFYSLIALPTSARKCKVL